MTRQGKARQNKQKHEPKYKEYNINRSIDRITIRNNNETTKTKGDNYAKEARGQREHRLEESSAGQTSNHR